MPEKCNGKNYIKFRKAKNLYVVEPIVQFSASWLEMSDVPDMKKARTLHFKELKGKKLYAKFVRIGEKSFWETYIVDHTNVSIIYLPTFSLNPVTMYKH